jgi:hypothetical protein
MYTLENYQEDKQFEQMLIAHYEDPSRSLVKLLFQQSEKLSPQKEEIRKTLEKKKN